MRTTNHNSNSVNWALLAVRVVVGIMFILHGSQKLFGAFDGPGLAGIVQFLGPVGYLVTIGEFFGGIGLLVGILPRFSAAANIVIMLGAIIQVHAKNGFFASNGGYELNLALIGLLLPILIAGPGRFSVSELVRFGRTSDSTQTKTITA